VNTAALVISIFTLTALAFGVWYQRRALTAEAADRQKQFQLLFEQAATGRRARVAVVELQPFHWVVFARYSFRLTNTGKAFARDASLTLHDSADHAVGSAQVVSRPLAPGASEKVSVTLSGVAEPAQIVVRWRDDEGEQVERTPLTMRAR